MASAHDLSRAVKSISSFGNATEPPPRVTQFTRPTSAHTDPLMQFTYTKAKLPQMDFTRKTAQNLPAEPTVSRLVPAQAADTSILPPVLTNQNPGSESAEDAGLRGSVSRIETALSDIPNADITHSNPAQISMEHNPLVATADATGGLASDIPVSPEDSVCLTTKITDSPSVLVNHGRTLPQKFCHPQAKAKIVPRDPKRSTDTHASTSESKSYGEILEDLLFRFKDDQEKQKELKASQHAKDYEIQDLKDVSHALFEQLQVSKGKEQVQQKKLSKFHAMKLQWEHRIEKLNKSVKDLTDDHQSLRNNAKDIQQQKEVMQTDKASLEMTLKDLHDVVEQDRSKTKKILLEARHQMEILEQTIEDQDRQLRENADCLDLERDRSRRLEDALSTITASYQDLTKLLTEHRDLIIENLNDQVRKNDTSVVLSSYPPDDLKPVLDQCFGILQGLQKVEMVKPEDLLALNQALNSYAESLTKSMQVCDSTSRATKEGQQQLSSELHTQFTNLNDHINVKDSLGEQIMDLREIKATIRERLQATEASLIETRQHVTALESQEKVYVRRISELETEAVRLQNKGSEITQIGLQLQESEARNQNLHEQIANSRSETLSISEQLQQKVEEVTSLRSRFVEVQSQLEEAQAEKVTFADQKLAYESQASAQSEKLRNQLSHDTSLELARAESKHLNEIKQLRQQKIFADAKAEQERIAAEARIEQLKDQVEKLQAEKVLSQSQSLRSATIEPVSQSYSPGSANLEPMAPPKGKHVSPSVRDMTFQGMPRQPTKSIMRTTRSEFSATISSEKRSAPAGVVDGMASKRPRKLVSQGLGPMIIPDSQSPGKGSGVHSSRGNRKLSTSTSKKTVKEDKYSRRFSQELEME